MLCTMYIILKDAFITFKFNSRVELWNNWGPFMLRFDHSVIMNIFGEHWNLLQAYISEKENENKNIA